MIAHRMLASEIYGNGLKYRVIACRKRLRRNRAPHSTVGNVDADELFPETLPSVSDFSDYVAGNLPECSAIATTLVRLDSRSPFLVEQAEGGESILLAGEQGVGIT